MKNETAQLRTCWVNLRVTPEEKRTIARLASESGMSVGDLLRTRLGQHRVRSTKVEREKVLQLARIGNNLNQLARWANTHKRTAEAAAVIARLAVIEDDLKCI
ncbi:plasmid mobilization protein [Pseudodesulfovibrio tunisiensis]|uniref:plasmid mobilization protein n=1 Tax=Pseudodesulfovibrio tunisiensis TaxID=463192 RepID=UPI001FB36DAB|nr:plasmid mobilization relaxosome protein MobC [Pseudodesulfovibrio tunisiensis]